MDVTATEVDRSVANPDVGSVGAVVCTHDRARLRMLRAAVASIDAQTHPVDELLVVVDGADELAAEVGRVLPGVRVVSLGGNRGVSVARTRGAELVGTDLVVFLDDDAEADPAWLARLLRPLTDPAVLGVTGRSLARFGGPRPGWLPEEFMWVLGCSYLGMPRQPARVRNFYGGCAIVRRSTFLELGGFDPAVGHRGRGVGGGEEADFCLRATAEIGAAFAFEPDAVIHHHVPPARLTWGYFSGRCFHEGVAKARMSRRLGDPGATGATGALGPERSFARGLPVAVLRLLPRPSRWARATGIIGGALAVVSGLVVGTVAGLVEDRRGSREQVRA